MKKIFLMILIIVSSMLIADQIKVTSTCNIRSKPLRTADVVGKVNDINIVLNVLNIFGDYINVKSDKIQGWVWEKSIIEQSNNIFVIVNGGCKVRSTSDKSSSVIGTINGGTIIEKISTDVTWYMISYSNIEGWIYTSSVQPIINTNK